MEFFEKSQPDSFHEKYLLIYNKWFKKTLLITFSGAGIAQLNKKEEFTSCQGQESFPLSAVSRPVLGQT
jgi:hypothetical protein